MNYEYCMKRQCENCKREERCEAEEKKYILRRLTIKARRKESKGKCNG